MYVCRYVVPPFEQQQLTYSFLPRLIEKHEAKLFIQASNNLTWTYPLVGVPEGTIAEPARNFTCAARTRLEEKFTLRLNGLREGR